MNNGGKREGIKKGMLKHSFTFWVEKKIKLDKFSNFINRYLMYKEHNFKKWECSRDF